jgi:hypothetical protein
LQLNPSNEVALIKGRLKMITLMKKFSRDNNLSKTGKVDCQHFKVDGVEFPSRINVYEGKSKILMGLKARRGKAYIEVAKCMGSKSFLQFHNEYGSTRKAYDTFKKYLQGDEDE